MMRRVMFFVARMGVVACVLAIFAGLDALVSGRLAFIPLLIAAGLGAFLLFRFSQRETGVPVKKLPSRPTGSRRSKAAQQAASIPVPGHAA